MRDLFKPCIFQWGTGARLKVNAVAQVNHNLYNVLITDKAEANLIVNFANKSLQLGW